jgi:hypothetical protein
VSRPMTPTTNLEARVFRFVLLNEGYTWRKLCSLVGGREQAARHLLAGRSAPRPLVLAAFPESVVLDYLRRLRFARLRQVVDLAKER